MKDIAVLHVDPDRGWRGGQQQALYLHLELLAKGYKSCVICNPGAQLHLRLQEKNAPLYPIRFHCEADLLAALRLALYAKSKAYNILHLHSSHALSWGILAKLFYPSLKLVATRRVNVPISQNFLSAFKYKGNMLNAIVAISEATRSLMESDGIRTDKIHLVYSGIDISKYEMVKVPENFRSQWQIPDSAILIGTVAAIVPPKDYPNFISAAAHAAKKNPQLHFLVVGDGELKKSTEEMAQSLGLRNRITFTGFQSQIGVFLKAMDIFVLASRREGLGTAVLDAMSVGLPVIGTSAGGIAEMIEDKQSGIIVPARDSEALAQAILSLADDQELRAGFGRAALARVKIFSKERMAAGNIQVYKSL
jgi:glycosyltransferase involved in cell wall biosynthesis